MKYSPKSIGLALLLMSITGFAEQNTKSALSQPAQITAIDVLLEPDATMLQHAAANNARLFAAFPKEGFRLDATHTPHITLVQRFVRTADLDRVYAALGKVLASADVNSMKLEAFWCLQTTSPRSPVTPLRRNPFFTFSQVPTL